MQTRERRCLSKANNLKFWKRTMPRGMIFGKSDGAGAGLVPLLPGGKGRQHWRDRGHGICLRIAGAGSQAD